jgi:hypothetical protein
MKNLKRGLRLVHVITGALIEILEIEKDQPFPFITYRKLTDNEVYMKPDYCITTLYKLI